MKSFRAYVREEDLTQTLVKDTPVASADSTVVSKPLSAVDPSIFGPSSPVNKTVTTPDPLFKRMIEVLLQMHYKGDEDKLKEDLFHGNPVLNYKEWRSILGEELLNAADKKQIIVFNSKPRYGLPGAIGSGYKIADQYAKMGIEMLGGWDRERSLKHQDSRRRQEYEMRGKPYKNWTKHLAGMEHHQMSFRVWLENKNIFGFDEPDWSAQNVRPGKAPQRGPQDLPVERLNVQRVIDLLGRYDLGNKKPKSNFMNECRWGDHVGSVRAVVTPKINVKIQRLHQDLEGNEVWIMKKYFFIDDYNFAGKEDVVALEIFDQVKNINDEQLESPAPKVKLDQLVQTLSSKMNTLESSVLLPSHYIKRAAENEYNLSYYLRGGGRGGFGGASTVKNVMEVIVNLSQQPKTGLIKAMVTVVSNVSSGSRGGGTWVLMPSDFEEYFMPTQGRKEIVESIITALKTY